ncbi:MAG: hypothetical protein DHS20C18_14210 [Saprospiraceae bacterium]|nr:MAG: hypothetical protein DHS20C18_14210 [Saprospiraceae bacterium]
MHSIMALSSYPSFVKIDNLSNFSQIFEFQKELDEDYGDKKQIFFDSSSVISMAAGLTDMFHGKFRNSFYKDPQTLLLSCVYQGWLGPIYLLPPHLQEFIDKRDSSRLFPPRFNKKLIDEIWLELKLDYLAELKMNYAEDKLDKIQDFYKYENIKKDAIDYFKLIYLTKDSFWKERISHLLASKNPLLKITQFPEYNLNKILHQDSLFKRIKSSLDVVRPYRPKNNYIDGIALCFLQELLSTHSSSIGGKSSTPIPLFFTDDKAISEVVKKISEEEIDGIFPFIYEGRSGKNLIVQDANFFLVDAVFQKGRGMDLFKEFDDFIEQFWEWAEDSSSVQTMEKHTEHSDELKKETQDTVFLKFLKHWWDNNGLEHIKHITHDHYENEKELSKIDEQFEETEKRFREDLKRVNVQMGKTKEIFDILKDAYDELRSLKADFKKKFPDRHNLSYNPYDEFSTRFSFSLDCCERVQKLLIDLNRSIDEKTESFEDVRADIITDLLASVNEEDLHQLTQLQKKPMDKQNKEQRNKINLYAALGLLWTLEKFTLLEKICEIIRNKYSSIDTKNVYPDYQVAILHAAAILRNPLDDDIFKVKKILACIESKFAKDKYPVWINLSYGYYLLWKQKISQHVIPELLHPKDVSVNMDKLVLSYFKNGRDYIKKAVKYLEIELNKKDKKEDKGSTKKALRYRRFYYALNNYVYFEVMSLSSQAFEELELGRYVRMLEEAPEKGLGQARYRDTLARYYQRKAALYIIKENFNLEKLPEYQNLIERSINLVKTAVEEAKKSGLDDLPIFENLENELLNSMSGSEGIKYLQKLKDARANAL